jgi:hypothetical protein
MRLVQYLLFSRRLSSVADPGSGSGMGKKSGSGMNNPDHISESLKTIFGLIYLSSLMRIRDPRSGMEKFGSGINFPDPQHKVQAP